MRNNHRQGRRIWPAVLAALVLLALPALVQAAREPAGDFAAAGAEGSEDFAVRRLLQRAQDLFLAQEPERAVQILETLLDQYPSHPIRFEAALALGKHYLEAHQHLQAVNYLRPLRALGQDTEEELSPELRELYLEGLYLTGVAHFQMRQYGAAFPLLRRITNDYPNSVWANQSYYYIGMCHFAQGNWSKAIEALSLVGTFVDPDSPTVEYAEAGRRFYVKVADEDLPVLHRLGQPVEVAVETKSGDRETVSLIPLSETQAMFIGSLPTDLAPPALGDGTLQVVGGDEIVTRYLDGNTVEGKKDIARQAVVRVVATAGLNFTQGDYASPAEAAFLGQPVFLLLQDADLDRTPQADRAQVRVVARYELIEEEREDGTLDLERLMRQEEKRYAVRDEAVLTLAEMGPAPVRSGRFGAPLVLEAFRPDQPVDKADEVLTVAIGDELVASFVDEVHLGGRSPRQVEAALRVVSEIDARPRPVQYIVPDPLVRARKNLVEAEAFLELGRIFRSMGLMDGARERVAEGLARVDEIIRAPANLPQDLQEQAFRLRWELYLVADNLPAAIRTCQLFSRLFPHSSFADQALLQIGTIKIEQKDHQEAIAVFRQILALENSSVKAEAQFRIAEALEAGGGRPGSAELAIAAYKLTAERYPDSAFAGPSLAKLVDYYITTRDYTQAHDLLGQVFEDYPDADFLDSMLLKWVMVAYRMGNYRLAAEKCEALIFEYPASRFAERAKEVLPQIQARMGSAQ